MSPYILILILACLAVLAPYHAIARNGFQSARLELKSSPSTPALACLSRARSQATPAEPAARPQGIVRSWPSAGKMVAITFDDGPSKQFTPLYLKVLDRYDVHATFFLVGRHVQENPGLAAMIAESGNELGCHAFTHRNLEQMDPAAAMKEIASAKQLIEQDAHTRVFLFRPPGGHLDQPLIKMINGMGHENRPLEHRPRGLVCKSGEDHQ